MEEKMAYIYGEYLVEFLKDGFHIRGEAFYPGEKTPVGTITGHFYNYNNPEDTSHTKDDSIHVDILRVQAGHDKKGIGTFLMKKLIMDYADVYKVKHMTTTPSPTGRISMENLRKFYSKFRFGSGFIPKKIEFVDEDYLLNDVFEQTIEQNKKNNKVSDSIGVVTDTIGDFVAKEKKSDKGDIADPSNLDQHERLANTTKANRVGYQTTIHFLDECLKSKNDIVQVGGSGAVVYGIYLARKGHNVIIIEPDMDEVEKIKIKANDIPRIKPVHDTYDSLEDYESNSKDAVLCFGPMYSPISLNAKQKIISESLRVCKPGGAVFLSFRTNEMTILDKTFNEDYDFLSGPKFDKLTLRVVSPNSRMLTFDEIEVLFQMAKVKYTFRFAAEGISMLIRDKMEGMSEKQFNRWMDYHYKTCTKKETIGCSNHVIYVIKKPENN